MTKIQMVGASAIAANWFVGYQGGMEAIISAAGFWVSFAMWMALTARGEA